VDAAVMFLKSLTPNGRGVFRALAKLEAAARAEVDESGGGGGGGGSGPVTVSREVLYTKCRAAFVVSNPAALDGVLREMVDHEVLRVNEAAPDGLIVLLGRVAIDQVLVGIGED